MLSLPCSSEPHQGPDCPLLRQGPGRGRGELLGALVPRLQRHATPPQGRKVGQRRCTLVKDTRHSVSANPEPLGPCPSHQLSDLPLVPSSLLSPGQTSPHQGDWHSGQDNPPPRGTGLGVVGLASTHHLPVASLPPPPSVWATKMSPDIAKGPLGWGGTQLCQDGTEGPVPALTAAPPAGLLPGPPPTAPT